MRQQGTNLLLLMIGHKMVIVNNNLKRMFVIVTSFEHAIDEIRSIITICEHVRFNFYIY